jgi:UDP-N-acetyl-D-galactosamine dehydrogenase
MRRSEMPVSLPERVGIVGLGYVGLQLAVAFGRELPTVGFDIDPLRIAELRRGYDRTGEVAEARFHAATHLTLTSASKMLEGLTVYIIAVPTPVDGARRPDFRHLVSASELVARAIHAGSIAGTGGRVPVIVYESTVYPGCTEEVCVPILERSGPLVWGKDFKVGYSPERINPGDAEHTLERVVKVVAGQDAETRERLSDLYGLIVTAGIYHAPDIRTAEAAKVIENVQRDLNIALMNELSLLFHRLGLDTQEILKAARTKWNFLPFEPGLVGGHCIPVDPYYLTHKAQEAGYIPDVILAGRRTNDSMGFYVARETIRLLIRAGRVVRGATVLILGLTFKENVRDTRNTRVVDIAAELRDHEIDVSVFDPLVGGDELRRLGFSQTDDPFAGQGRYDAVILAVPHRAFRDRPAEDFVRLLRDDGGPGVFVDIRGAFPAIAGQGTLYWRL